MFSVWAEFQQRVPDWTGVVLPKNGWPIMGVL